MSESELGSVARDGDLYTLTLERHFDAPIEDAWDAITNPARMADWLATTKLELRTGGEIEIDFGGDEVIRGDVLDVEPPRVFEFEWRFSGQRGEPSIVRFELVRDGSGTRMTLTHRRQRARTARGTCAGWHAHADLLAAHVAGRRESWDDVYASARARYESVVASIA